MKFFFRKGDLGTEENGEKNGSEKIRQEFFFAK